MHLKEIGPAGCVEAETSMKPASHSGKDDAYLMQNLATDEGEKEGSPGVPGPRPSFLPHDS